MDQYNNFIEKHPEKKILIEGIEWKYITGGSGDDVLLLLPGGTRRPGMRFQFLMELEEKNRIISPFYPLICQMDSLTDGIATILENESVNNVNVFGASFGGLVAQFLLKKYPDRLSKVILSNTGTLLNNPESLKKLKRSQKLIRFIPDKFIRYIAKRSFIKGISFSEDVKPFYEQYLYESFSKQVVCCHFGCIHNFHTSFSITISHLENWPGKLLIINAKDDSFVGKESSVVLRSVFPMAEFYTFESGGHILSLTQHDKYLEVINRFLDEP